MHENAQKFEWKTWSKISCDYIWLLNGKKKVGPQCEHVSSVGLILGIDSLHADIVMPWEISCD